MGADRGTRPSPTADCRGVHRCPAPRTSPAWRPAPVWCYRDAFAPLSTNTSGSLKTFDFVGQIAKWAIRFNALMRSPNLESRTCPYCGKEFKPLRCHPHQVVCSADDCQRRRGNDYHRKRVQKDPLYKLLCEDAQKMWREQNPDYMDQYRASRRKDKTGRPSSSRAVRELNRLLSLVKNNLVKNASEFRVTRCGSDVWLVTPKKAVADKNNLTPNQVIVFQGVTLDGQAKNQKEPSSGNSTKADV